MASVTSKKEKGRSSSGASTVVSGDKLDRKEKVKLMMKWMSSNGCSDISSETAKKIGKTLYDNGIISMEKLAKKLKKDASYLSSGKMKIDSDDAIKLTNAVSTVFGITATAVATEEIKTVLKMSSTAPENYLDPAVIEADRKEKAEAMIAWFKTNTTDMTLPHMHRYAYMLYDDNCATMTKLARKMERDVKYMHSLGFDPDDSRDIIAALKLQGLMSADFTPFDEKLVSASERTPSSHGSHSRSVESAISNVDAAQSNYVSMFEMHNTVDRPFNWGSELVGLLVGIFSEDVSDWLEGCVVRYDGESGCHDVRFVDDFVLDVDLNTHRIRIEASDATTARLSEREGKPLSLAGQFPRKNFTK